MEKFLRFCVIGGDLRQIYTANSLVESGYIVSAYGFDEKYKDKFLKKVIFLKELKKTLELSDAIVLPLPYSRDFKVINTGLFNEEILIEELLSFTRKGQFLFAGMIDENFKEMLTNFGLNFFDYFKREELAVLNSVLTVEGALAIALNETPYTLFQCNSLVLGYGRIGTVLSKRLKDFGSNVTVCARKFEDLAWILTNGYEAKNFEEAFSNVKNFNIIFNTVPSKILTEKVLDCVDKNSLIIDLASKPGGVNFEYAKLIGLKVIWALSLPGKTAPQTAGKIIKDALLNTLKENSHTLYI